MDLPMQEDVALHAYELIREMQGMPPSRPHAACASSEKVIIASVLSQSTEHNPGQGFQLLSSMEEIAEQDILLGKLFHGLISWSITKPRSERALH